MTGSTDLRGIILARVLGRAAHAGAAAAALAAPVPSIAAAAEAPLPVHPYAASVSDAARRFGIPEAWIWRVMHAESRGNPRAVSRAGARGLMQIMPATWAMLTERHRLGPDPFDARANIHAGTAYLRAMWDRYHDLRLMLAAYNAGPGRVDAYVAGRRQLPAETLVYVAAIAPDLEAGSPGRRAEAQLPPAPGWRGADIFAVLTRGLENDPGAASSPGSDAPGDDGRAPGAGPDRLFPLRSRKAR